ncbi:hypothetical protein L21TH_2395 [Caldisalinibacter kiritimatiensis]|uniref:Uncharacterized protein n=1 Tax=Caldisalinibacter kiritimatiensis TaxID=1304284 RepID=R1CLJ6_9FIRM|nr:hypothetical protein L21TH_2395 [Caldisalinibacter kiritimatiensis]
MKIINKLFKKPWPYWVGGILLGILNVILLATTGLAWKLSTGFSYWGGYILQKLGIDVFEWNYYQVYKQNLKPGETLINNYYTVMIIAIVLGSLISTLFASEFRIKKIKNKKQLIFGLLGGILMGYGTRLSLGCNIGAFFSAIPSFSLHSWVFGIFMFLGVWLGSKILIKYIL